MIRALLVLMLVLQFSCSGFSKAPRSAIPVGYDDQFLYWCKNAKDGFFWDVFLEQPAECETEISRGVWDHYPIIVNADSGYETETMEAVEAFNAQLGFMLFDFQITNLDPDVIVTEGGTRPFIYAVAKHITIDGRDYGMIFGYNGLADADRSDVIMHELGHIVGLRHDRYNPKSVMFHTDGLLVSSLERQDIFALRSIYLGR